ncbi:MAG: TetR/AcrR family transcriptional regulator [Dehalococcoidales bacterium]|nr:MAG: TetR/AcrR family transcriptional regulator [Dehalococcoidales bacterium]
MNGFEKRKEQKKESIIRAALDLFMQYGFKKVSVNDIAVKANVSPVTIYNHYGNKDSLVHEVIRYQLGSMIENYRKIIHGDGTFPEKLKEIVFNKVEVASQFRGELASIALRDNSVYSQPVHEEFEQEALKMTLDLFEEGKKEGYIGKDISEKTLIIYFDILKSGITTSTRLYTDEESYPRIVRELNELFLYGLVDTGDRPEFKNQQ